MFLQTLESLIRLPRVAKTIASRSAITQYYISYYVLCTLTVIRSTVSVEISEIFRHLKIFSSNWYLIINPQLCQCVVTVSKPNGWTDLDETLHVHLVWPNSGSLLGFELIFGLVCCMDQQGPHYYGWQKSPSVTNQKSPSVTNLKILRLSLIKNLCLSLT